MDLQQLARLVSDKTGIPWGPRNAERALAAVFVSDSLWEIAHKSDEPLPAVSALVGLLLEEGMLRASSEGIFLTEDGKAFCERAGVPPFEDHTCPSCGGRGLSLDKFKGALERFYEIQRDRPEAAIRYDQGYVTLETTFARIALADGRGDLRGKDVIIFGDDDLVGLALAMTGLARRVAVVEIDERIVEFEREAAVKLGLNFEVIMRDVRLPLPQELLKRFDTFFTDPPETVEAMRVFVGRGISALKGVGGAGYFGLTRVESSLVKWRSVERLLLDMGVTITDIIHHFNEYVNWGYLEQMKAWELAPVKQFPSKNWYYSSMFRIEVVESVEVPNADATGRDIYTDSESSTV